MRHVRLGVDRLKRASVGWCRALLDADGRILAGQRFDHLENSRGIGQFGSQCPLRALAQSFPRLDRLFLALGDDAEEGAVPHHGNHARDRLGGGFVGAVELRAVARRTYHPTMQHTRRAHVLHKHQAAGDLRRDVETRNGFSHDLMARRRLRGGLRGRFPIEIGIEFGVTDFAAVRRRNDAVGDLQLIRSNAKPRRCEVDQYGACLGACHTQRGAAVLD